MNETQFYVSVAVMPAATFVIVMIGVLLNNYRLNDVRDLLRAGIGKSHSELLVKFVELDTRLSRIEAHLNLR
jgi:hypothetical protein